MWPVAQLWQLVTARFIFCMTPTNGGIPRRMSLLPCHHPRCIFPIRRSSVHSSAGSCRNLLLGIQSDSPLLQLLLLQFTLLTFTTISHFRLISAFATSKLGILHFSILRQIWAIRIHCGSIPHILKHKHPIARRRRQVRRCVPQSHSLCWLPSHDNAKNLNNRKATPRSLCLCSVDSSVKGCPESYKNLSTTMQSSRTQPSSFPLKLDIHTARSINAMPGNKRLFRIFSAR